jgi:hypothetical protein
MSSATSAGAPAASGSIIAQEDQDEDSKQIY